MPENASYTHDVFISYSTKNRPWVNSVLVPRLDAADLRTLIDYRDFDLGRPVIDNIERAVDSCRHTLLVITPAWIDGDWTSLEQLLLATKDPAGRQQRMIPVVVEPSKLPRRLAIFTYADLTSQDESMREAALARVISTLTSRRRIFVAHSADDTTDVTLKNAIAKALLNSGHDVDSVLPVGLRRRDGLRAILAECHFMVALFSTASSVDKRFLADVAEARSNPDLVVLPVRVRYLEALPGEIRDITDAGWRGPEDDEYVIQRILDAVVRHPAVAGASDSPVRQRKKSRSKKAPAPRRTGEPIAGMREARGRQHAASGAAKLWVPGNVITIGFLDGEAEMRWRVAEAASEWTRYANLRFAFTQQTDAMVRISFRADPGSWAFTATDALAIPMNQPTANFGWFAKNTPDDELRRIVLHEFGHVLGMIHEHQLASAEIPWNREAASKEYTGPPNYWTLQQLEMTLFDRYPEDYFPFPKQFDPTSIMAFPISANLTDGKFEIGTNNVLSDGDKEFAARLYP